MGGSVGCSGKARCTFQLAGSFHQDMKAWIRPDGVMLENIILPKAILHTDALTNLYTCLVVEQWLARVDEMDGVMLTVKYKYDKKLFRR